MIANYHTHTPRCHHAVGEEREYIERAIESGLTILGFSDHTPVPFAEGYVSGIRMLPSELEDYVDTVLALKEEYKRDIEIHVGLEVEYYPRYVEAMQDMIAPYPIEYFLLGQHFAGNEAGEVYYGSVTRDPEILLAYCRQVTEGLESGLFTYLAHPDLINFVGNEDLYRTRMLLLCKKARELQIPLEINLLGLSTGRHYPNELFWKIAGEAGCDAVLGADAHRPGAVYNEEAERAGRALAERYGLHLLETVPLVSPKRS